MWIVAVSAFLSDVILPLKASGKQSNVGHGSHIGGSVFGATVYVINRLWGAKLHKFVRKSASFIKKLVPAQIKNICRKLWKLCCRVVARVGRMVYSLPWLEMFVIAFLAFNLAICGED